MEEYLISIGGGIISGNGQSSSVGAGAGLRQLGPPHLRQLFRSARSPALHPTRPTHRPSRVERVRAWGGPSVHLSAPSVGGLGGCDKRSAAALRPVLECESAKGGTGWRPQRRPFQGWKVLVKSDFRGTVAPRRPAPTPENVGPPLKLGPPLVPVITTYVLPLSVGRLAGQVGADGCGTSSQNVF